MFTFLVFFCTILSTVLLSVFTGLIAHWYDFYWVLVFFVGGYLTYTIASVLFVFVVSLFLPKKPDVPKEKDNPFARFILGEYVRFMTFFFGIKPIVTREDKLPEGRFLLVSNHRSNYDPLATISVFSRKRKISFVAKKSLMNLPIAGNFMYQSCFLAMDRDDVRQSLKVINKAAEYIKKDVCSMGIYPEGTRNTTEEPLLPFKPGALKVAQKAGCPIAVMTIVNTDKVRKRFPFLRTRVYVDIVKVYSAEEVASQTTNDLTAQIEEEMKRSIASAKTRRV